MSGLSALFLNSITRTSPTTPISAGSADSTLNTSTDSVAQETKTKVINTNQNIQRSNSTSPSLYSYMSSPREIISRYIFGFNAKTKRTLAEEAESGEETSVCSWIIDGCDPNEEDAYGYTPILNAAAMGRVNVVKELIKYGADINRAGPFGFTALHAAAQSGHREVVAVLLEKGANINAQNDDKDTAMHLALRGQRIEIVYMLLRNNGNPKIEGFQGKDCVQIAQDCGLMDVAVTLKNFNPSIGYHPHSAPEMQHNTIHAL